MHSDHCSHALRIRKVLREDRPRLEPADVGALLRRSTLSREIRRPGHRRIRAAASRPDISDLQQLDERDLARVGIRADGREITLLGLVEQLSEHDRDHRWRIASILGGFASGK